MATSLSTGLQELFDWSRDLTTRLPLDSALSFERRLTHIPLDLYETQDEVVVHAYLPGFRQEKVQVELDQNRLLIKAERDLPENQNVNWIQVESPYGSVYRSLVIGPMIKALIHKKMVQNLDSMMKAIQQRAESIESDASK